MPPAGGAGVPRPRGRVPSPGGPNPNTARIINVTNNYYGGSGGGASGVSPATIARAAGGDPIAIAEVVKAAIEDIKKRFQSAGAHVGAAIESEGVGTAGGHGLRAAGDIAGIADPTGMTEGLFKFSAMLVESVDKLKEFANKLHESNIKFAEFSGSMTQVMVKQELREMQLSQQRGERRAESAEKLAQAKNRLDVAVAPLEDKWAEAKGWITGALSDAVAIPIVNIIKKGLEFFGLKIDEDKNEDSSFLAAQDKFLRQERPNRFR